MDQGRMDAEGGRVIHRGKRARKLAVVAAQNLLVVCCLLATLYVYRELHSWVSGVMDGDEWTSITWRLFFICFLHQIFLRAGDVELFVHSFSGPSPLQLCFIPSFPGASTCLHAHAA